MQENKELTIKWSSVFQTIIVTIVIGALTWGWSLESRISKLEANQNIIERVEHLENSLMPVLIEYNMRENLRKMGYVISLKESKDETVSSLELAESIFLKTDKNIEDKSNNSDNYIDIYDFHFQDINDISDIKQSDMYKNIEKEVKSEFKKFGNE